jgi:hypothetical protein
MLFAALQQCGAPLAFVGRVREGAESSWTRDASGPV